MLLSGLSINAGLIFNWGLEHSTLNIAKNAYKSFQDF